MFKVSLDTSLPTVYILVPVCNSPSELFRVRDACQASDDLSLAILLSILPQHFCCLSGMYNSFLLLSKVCCLRHLCCFQLLSFPQNSQFFLVSIQIHDVPRSSLVRFWRCLTLTVESLPFPDLQEQWKVQAIMPDSWVLIQHSGR